MKIIFLCTPNNPTGNVLEREEILKIIKGFQGLVVVDEAYGEFADCARSNNSKGEFIDTSNSLVEEIKNYPNLVVIQTLSKAWGLAGLRVGMCFADSTIIEMLDKIKSPYNVGILSQHVAEGIIRKYLQEKQAADSIFSKQVEKLVSQRKWLEDSLTEAPYVEEVYPSQTNFILVKTSDPKKIYNHLLAAGIVVRNRDSEHNCKGCLRISVGTEEENIRLVKVWKQLA